MPRPSLRVAVAQTHCRTGDLEANVLAIEQAADRAIDAGAKLLVTPELAVSGYAVGPAFADAAMRRDAPLLRRLRELSRRIDLTVGLIEETDNTHFYNTAVYLHRGEVRHVHRKIYLPNYGKFDERRYFGAGQNVWAFDTPWTRMAILICGDAWHLTLPYMAVHDGANVLLILAASSEEGLAPNISCSAAWTRMNQSYALTLSTFVVFANHGGAEGDLHFWGGSHVIRPDGAISAKATYGEPDLLVADLDLASLRNQRLILPFRRDDSLALTVEMGRRVLHHKAKRRDGFLSALASHRVPAAPGTPGEAGRPQHLGLDGVDAAFNDRDQPAPYPDPSR